MNSCSKAIFGILTLVITARTGTIYAQRPQDDLLSLHALFGAETLASNVNAVRHKAASLPHDAKNDFLKRWVLPSATHPDFRVIGEFTPTDPSLLAIELEPYRFPSMRGGELVAPVFDLLDTASELGRLGVLYRSIQMLPETSDLSAVRARVLMRLLIRLEQQRDDDVAELVKRWKAIEPAVSTQSQAHVVPELIVLSRAISHHRQYQLFGDLLAKYYEARFALAVEDQWETYLTSLLGEYEEFLARTKSGSEAESTEPHFWIPVKRPTAYSRGNGFPQLKWSLDDQHEVHHISGHYRDYLMFRTPLVGDFELSAEVNAHHNSQILVGDNFCGLKDDCERLFVGGFRDYASLVTINPPFRRHEPWVQHRVVMRDGQQTVFFHGWPMYQPFNDEDSDPWTALRSVGPIQAHFRHVHISGSPEIPESVSMSSSKTLSDWIPYYYFSESVGAAGSHWRSMIGPDGEREILGGRRLGIDGSWFESLLSYQRPLVEDGTIEFDLFYVPGEVEAHPALDRLVFLLAPDGVRLHWLTDGEYDRTPVGPENTVSLSQIRSVPLRANAWNHLKLSIAGQIVSLELNARSICEYELDALNQRTFGLFHYADQTSLRVRHVKMRGDWPKVLPPVHQQELVDPRLVDIERNREGLKEEFEYRFVESGLPEEKFAKRGGDDRHTFSFKPDGAHLEIDSKSPWNSAQIVTLLGLSGDFDVQASFELAEMDDSLTDLLISLDVHLDDENQHYVSSMRSWNSTSKHNVISQIAPLTPGGQRRFLFENQIEWIRSGRLRIARIDKQFYVMFAPEDSGSYRIIGSPVISDADVMLEGILLQLVLNGNGKAHVIWKELSIQADVLKYSKKVKTE